MFEMLTSAFLMGTEAFFMPLRMIGAIALGVPALDPAYSLTLVATVGVLIHVALSAVYGIMFAILIHGRHMTAAAMAIAGGLFGFALWLINFYLIAPGAFPWFLQSNQVVQLVAHTKFFGMVLGLVLAGSTGRTVRSAT